MTATTPSTTKPAATVRLGAIHGAIWRNTDAEGKVRYSATIERRYRDNTDRWQSSGSFGRDELLTVGKVADRLNSLIHELVQRDRDADGTTESEDAAA